MYHWYLPNFVLRFIELVSHGLIAEEYVFVLTDVGWEVVALETAVLMALVREVTRAARTFGSMTDVAFALLLLSSSSCLILVLLSLILPVS